MLQHLEEPSIIVMDNASYHSVLSENYPKANEKKANVQKWLSGKEVEYSPVLCDLIHQPTPSYQTLILLNMTSPNFNILDRTLGDRKFKILTHALWDNFTDSLRTYSPQRQLITLLEQRNIPFPQEQAFSNSAQLVALPTSAGIKVYIPTKGDFFFREELKNETSQVPKPSYSTQNTKFGISNNAGFSDSTQFSKLISWNSILPVIKLICEHIIRDIKYFEDLDLSMQKYTNFNLEYAKCEIQFLSVFSKFVIAAASLSQDYSMLSAEILLTASFSIQT